MAIQKKLLHFKTWENFNSQKLSANANNATYTIGVNSSIIVGSPTILYESIVWIKDVKKIWTHGQLYDCSSEITSVPATSIVAPTGVKNISNDVWALYSSQVPYHRANRLAFLEDDEFLFETSTDSGSTWTSLAKTDEQRKVFVGENIGGVSFPSDPSNRIRVTITPRTTRYFMADWFYLWVQVPYAVPAPTTVDIEYSTGSAPDTWLTYATNIPVEGQTGPNMIWYGKLMGSGTAAKNVRFTFKNNNNSSVAMTIKGIEAHGVKSWIDINTMAKTDRLYSIGVDKSATFPGSINCTEVNISGDTIATQNTLKTINGQTLVGSGDIATNGYEWKYSCSPGQTCGLYVNNKMMVTNILSGQLTIQLPTTNPTSDNYTKECGITFTTGSTAPTIIFNGNIWWVNGTAPTIDANCVYEFSFKFNFANNTWLGVYASFKTA